VARTILVVDDEHPVRTVLTRTLAEAGYSVLAASGAREALRLIESPEGQDVKVVITDVAMPGMGGRDLAARLLQRSPAPSLVFITGFASPRTRATLPGALFEKPLQHDQLLAHLESLLDRS
jgi:CheY-like chemotaxis protein